MQHWWYIPFSYTIVVNCVWLHFNGNVAVCADLIAIFIGYMYFVLLNENKNIALLQPEKGMIKGEA